jgi:hypothetical protein
LSEELAYLWEKCSQGGFKVPKSHFPEASLREVLADEFGIALK